MLGKEPKTEMSKDFEEHLEEEKGELFKTYLYSVDEEVDCELLKEMLFATKQIYKSGRYSELLSFIGNSMNIGEVTLKKIQGQGLSYAIISSERVLNTISEMDIDTKEAEILISQAKRNFEEGEYKSAKSSIQKFREVSVELKSRQKDSLQDSIDEVELRTQETKKIGANVNEVERLLTSAKISLQNELLADSYNSVNLARETIEEIRTERINLIKDSIGFVEKLIADAKRIGANEKSAERHLDQAKEQFLNEDFQMCMHTTIQAEEVTNDLIIEQVKMVQNLEKTLDSRFRAAATQEPSVHKKLEELNSESKKPKVKIVCETCGAPLEYMDRYRRWFCNTCQRYI
jgi:uncharacterized protein (UPF0332 family)